MQLSGCLSCAAAVAAVSAACSGDSATDPVAEPIQPGATYVSLGSSYAAGIGIGPGLLGAGGCGVSGRNYAHLVAEELELQLVDASCSGARTKHVLDTPLGGSPPQIDWVTPDAALITVTIGGNDVGYVGSMIRCGDPTNVCTIDEAQLDTDFRALSESLRTMFEQLQARAPRATVVLDTYPRLVYGEACAALSLDSAEADAIRSIGERLQRTFVEVSRSAGVAVADPYAAPGEHGPCAAPGESWLDGKVSSDPSEGFPYHPNATGHRGMAELLLGALGR